MDGEDRDFLFVSKNVLNTDHSSEVVQKVIFYVKRDDVFGESHLVFGI